jgi:hypothetical protein
MRRVWRDAALLFGVEELQQACYVTMSLFEDLEAGSTEQQGKGV